MAPTPEQALIALYRAAAQRLRVRIRAALQSGQIGTAAYRARQLQAIRLELRRLGIRTAPLARSTIALAYEKGLALGDAGLAHVVELGAERQAAFVFTGSHPHAAAAIADNMATRLGDAGDLVGRRVDDAFRQAGLEETGAGIAEGATRREVSAALERALVENRVTDSLTGFIDRAGRRWQLDVYSKMVARTTTREAMTAATRNRLLEAGHDLVTISDHGTQTEICQEFEGNTYSLTGATEGFDVLEAEPPFHPNCLHVLTAGSGDLEADLDVLEASFGGDGG